VDESGDKVVSAQWSIFVVGAGGFGGKRNSEHIVPPVDPPKRKPDASLTYKTSIDQVRMNFRCLFIKRKQSDSFKNRLPYIALLSIEILCTLTLLLPLWEDLTVLFFTDSPLTEFHVALFFNSMLTTIQPCLNP
jgi:hypothetical protein